MAKVSGSLELPEMEEGNSGWWRAPALAKAVTWTWKRKGLSQEKVTGQFLARRVGIHTFIPVQVQLAL
jgi:hypothetical protein